MPLWRIQPVTPADDSRWLDHPMWKEVIVRAGTAAMARLAAAELERDPDSVTVGNESLGFRSAFEDEKLYWVKEVAPEETAALGGEEGPAGVVRSEKLEGGWTRRND